MTSVFIDGQAGTTGLQIHDRLKGRTDITLLTIEPIKRKDPEARREMLNSADVAILCLPDETAKAPPGESKPSAGTVNYTISFAKGTQQMSADADRTIGRRPRLLRALRCAPLHRDHAAHGQAAPRHGPRPGRVPVRQLDQPSDGQATRFSQRRVV